MRRDVGISTFFLRQRRWAVMSPNRSLGTAVGGKIRTIGLNTTSNYVGGSFERLGQNRCHCVPSDNRTVKLLLQ